MQLSIENVGKIKSCSVDIDGITVIAGNNNTGKSTISRALFSIIESFRDLDAKIVEDKKNAVLSAIFSALPQVNRPPTIRKISDKVFEIIEDHIGSPVLNQRINDYLLENVKAVKGLDHDELQEMTEMIMDSVDVPDREITKVRLNRVFNSEFNGQVNHINYGDAPAGIGFHDDNSHYGVTFINDDCIDFIYEAPSYAKAIYIDSPSVIDDIDERYGMSSFLTRPYDEDVLLNALSRKTDHLSLVIEVINNRKLENILDRIDDVVGGEYDDSDSGIQWKDKDLNAPLELANLSSGLKMFAIIKRLLENGALRSGDFLIMDEPEIHLHPQWQIIFAEILVLLNKEFELKILINTHSPYFLSAIETYSKKHQVKQSLKIYKSAVNDSYASISDVTNSVQEVYEQMAKPFQNLEDQAYE
jgi:predicted ATPase